jgi:hypothetical protein
MFAALSSLVLSQGFQPVTRHTKFISEYGLWVELGCVLLDERNSGWMTKSKVVLDYKLEHTNRELDEQLTCRRRAPGCLNRGEAGRPGPTDLGGFLPLPASVFFQHTHPCFVTLWPRAPRVAPPKLSHPLFCLHYWSFHLMSLLWVMSMLLCFTCLHDFPAKQGLAAPHACPLHVALMKNVGGASRDASWCMHG